MIVSCLGCPGMIESIKGYSDPCSLKVNFAIAIPAQTHTAFAGQRLSDTSLSKLNVGSPDPFRAILDSSGMVSGAFTRLSSSLLQDARTATTARQKTGNRTRILPFLGLTAKRKKTLHLRNGRSLPVDRSRILFTL